MTKIKYIPLLIILVFGFLFTACNPTAPENANTQNVNKEQRPVVRVGYLRLLSGTPLYTAIHEGYFAEEGINVEIRTIKSGPEGNEALAAGNIDVAFSILPSLVVANERGVPSDLVSIYGASIDSPAINDHRIIVSKTSTIRRVEDLRGKKLAVVGWPGLTSDGLELLDYLERHNLSAKDVTLVGMAHGDMVASLQSGAIDAAAAAEPYITLGELQGAVKTLEENQGFYYQNETEVTTYLARRSWIDSNRNVAEKFIRALERGRQRASDREWLIKTGLPSFNNKAIPPIDFVELTSEQSAQLRLMPIRPMPSENGLRHVAEQLLKRGAIKQIPSDFNALILPINKGQ
jgi:NitT/TauT family transport system substrate-binding protein